MVKYTTGGSLVWYRGYGLTGYDLVNDASTDGTGNLYFAGRTETSLAGPNKDSYDGYVIKLDPSGGYVWRKNLGTSAYDMTNAVLVRTDAHVFAAGSTYGLLGFSNGGNGDAFLSHLRGSNGSTVCTDQ